MPVDQLEKPVAAWAEPMVIDTYLPAEPEDYPAFLETRVYQGSSGKVYPLPFHDRVEAVKQPHTWQALHLENRWVRLVILPELGGRIHVGYDKSADYDFFYRNNVIKPALVGLAGPWLSGGVEFNWPQHHRPATFLPTDWVIEREDDGAVTVWCSDHEPMTRMKGMHGIRLRPGSSLVEARVRLHNRTDEPQTFLWWANAAAAVDDQYQSFFPTDVHHVADHAKRAVTTFPHVEGRYYGVDYPAQVTPETPDGDRLDWYRNVPVPTSYMVASTREAFFGGYDHGRAAGFVHWADPAISPGKKQWTWGNSPFGWAWDANLTDGDGPYVELMAGVYTDNQPDFSWIAPGETKSFSQYWYPIRVIGPAHFATLEVAIRLDVTAAGPGTDVVIGVAATSVMDDAIIELIDTAGTMVKEWSRALSPDSPAVVHATLAEPYAVQGLGLRVRSQGATVAEWRHRNDETLETPSPASEPGEPAAIGTVEELFLTGQHLEQNHHATWLPEPYWEEALRRDPGDARCNTALGARLDHSGRHGEAEIHFRNAIARLVHLGPNPADGEAYYRLGICLERQGRVAEGRVALEKAAWSAAWRAPAGWAMARLAALEGDLLAAARHARTVLALDAEHPEATCLLALVLRATGGADDATVLLEDHLRRDPLHQWTRDLAGLSLTSDAPTLLDVAIDYARCGFRKEALRVLGLAAEASRSTALGQVQVGPLVHYQRAQLLRAVEEDAAADEALLTARTTDGRHCLASRLADVSALESALTQEPTDARAELLLGNWLYDQRRRSDAVAAWTRSLAHSPSTEVAVMAHRNLAIAAVNLAHDTDAAAGHFAEARLLAPDDARLLFEEDQLLRRHGVEDASRLARLEARVDLVFARDDLTLEFGRLLTAVGRAQEAGEILCSRRFQPWEGGEGQALAAWDEAMLVLARRAIERGDGPCAVDAVQRAVQPPQSLGEARHPLANAAEIHWWLGAALETCGDKHAAREAWETAASFSGDFSGMATHSHSTQTAFSIKALRALCREADADRLLADLTAYADGLETTPARIDYFATSLPAMRLFHDDPQVARDDLVATLRSQVQELIATTRPVSTEKKEVST